MSVLPTVDPVCLRGAETSPIAAIIDARPRDLGGFTVGRVLPSPVRPGVGPFVFFDHFGTAELASGHGIDVRPHLPLDRDVPLRRRDRSPRQPRIAPAH